MRVAFASWRFANAILSPGLFTAISHPSPYFSRRCPANLTYFTCDFAVVSFFRICDPNAIVHMLQAMPLEARLGKRPHPARCLCASTPRHRLAINTNPSILQFGSVSWTVLGSLNPLRSSKRSNSARTRSGSTGSQQHVFPRSGILRFDPFLFAGNTHSCNERRGSNSPKPSIGQMFFGGFGSSLERIGSLPKGIAFFPWKIQLYCGFRPVLKGSIPFGESTRLLKGSTFLLGARLVSVSFRLFLIGAT